jgi:tetratricopeptide (TPR) repeat protein
MSQASMRRFLGQWGKNVMTKRTLRTQIIPLCGVTVAPALFLMFSGFALADPNGRVDNHIRSSFVRQAKNSQTRVFDNAFLDRLFGKQREAKQEKSNIGSERQPNATMPVATDDPFIPPNRAFTAGIQRNTSAKRAAALRLAEKGRQLLLRKDRHRAITHLERALSLYSIPHIHFYLARAHYELGQFQHSLNFLEVAEAWLAEEPSWTSEIADLKKKASSQQTVERDLTGRRMEVALKNY